MSFLNWINTKDRLPDKSGRYLTARLLPTGDYMFCVEIYSTDLKKDTDTLTGQGWYALDYEWNDEYYIPFINYWMPIPPIPNENVK